jgi:hypothetical protein
MDVLAPGIREIIGCSQREEQPEVLDRNMAERGIDREHYALPLPPPRAVASGGGLGWGRSGGAPLTHQPLGLVPLYRGAGEQLCAECAAAPLPHRGRGWRAARDG